MSICLGPRRILQGHNLFQARRHAFPLPLTPFRLSFGAPRLEFHSSARNDDQRPSALPNRKPCPVPPGLRKDPTEWIKHLEKFIPRRNLDKSSTTAGTMEQKSEQKECEAILELLYQAREQLGFDLLSILGFKLDRWQDFHAIVNKLLNFTNESRPRARREQLPSNIRWASLGSFDDLSSDTLRCIEPSDIKYGDDDIPASSFNTYLEGSNLHNQLRNPDRRPEVMSELWQSLGIFILEAADLPTEDGFSVMSHFYRVVARLHHLDMIPPEVYKYVPKRDPALPNRPPGMYLLSYPIMSVLSDAAWEAAATQDAIDGAEPGTTPYIPPLTYKSKQLGFGIWLEFVLWCCVEEGCAVGATWILQMSRNRSKTWSIKSWAALCQTNGSIDPLKMSHYDTWAECGELSNERSAGRSHRPFLGMGERTITKEVVISIMDGLINSLEVETGTQGDSFRFVWVRLGLLRALLGRNKLSLSQEDLTYLIIRILETEAIIPEIKPQSLELLLNQASYIHPQEQLAHSSSPGLENAHQQEYHPANSLVVLGLYQYALNIYASSGNISGTIDVFERLLGDVDPKKVAEVRDSVLDPKYCIMAHRVRQTVHSRFRNSKSASQSQDFELPPVSWALLLDTLTSSRLYRLAEWVTDSCAEALKISTSRTREGALITDSLIRLATATKNHQLYSNAIKRLRFPLERQTLILMLNWRIGECNWTGAVELLHYLRDTKLSQWDVENITSLGAMIIRLENWQSSTDQSELDPTLAKSQAETLGLANTLLVDFLSGKFNQHYSYANGLRVPEATLNRLYRVFSSIPGSLSRVCYEVQLQWSRPFEPDYYIPSYAFNQFLAAVVDTQGSLAGKRLWDKVCIDPLLIVDPTRDRKQQTIKTGLPFNSRSIYPKKTPLVSPDLTTVRIIANAALEEQKSLQQRGHYPIYSATEPLTSEKYTAESVGSILAWSARVYERLGLGPREINRELDGYPTQKATRPTDVPPSTLV
ncbi:hypothetical protein MferCBS31731_006379 [Microsporum ferrugineum]